MIEPPLSGPSDPVSSNTLRQFAGAWLLFFGGLAFFRGFVRHQMVLASVFALSALALGPLGLIRPKAIRPVFQGCMAVARPIGWVTSHIILACMFYGVFTPIAFFFKLIGRDVLQRKRRTGGNTYWLPKPRTEDPASYLSQA